jgi:hypothetical protein
LAYPKGKARPAGAGRKKGTPNKAPSKAAITEQAAKVAAGTELTPLEYMLQVMRDPLVDPERRDDMAKAAAPYVHGKIATQLEHSGPGGEPLHIIVERTYVSPVD